MSRERLFSRISASLWFDGGLLGVSAPSFFFSSILWLESDTWTDLTREQLVFLGGITAEVGEWRFGVWLFAFRLPVEPNHGVVASLSDDDRHYCPSIPKSQCCCVVTRRRPAPLPVHKSRGDVFWYMAVHTAFPPAAITGFDG